MRTSREIDRALSQLEGSPNFNVVMSWLQEHLTDQHDTNDYLPDPVRLHQGQGRAQVLREIIESVHTARERLSKY